MVGATNAALALVQLGDEPAAIKEMQKASRRAPGSADLRAALAALYWSQVPAALTRSTTSLQIGCQRPCACSKGAASGPRACAATDDQGLQTSVHATGIGSLMRAHKSELLCALSAH